MKKTIRDFEFTDNMKQYPQGYIDLICDADRYVKEAAETAAWNGIEGEKIK